MNKTVTKTGLGGILTFHILPYRTVKGDADAMGMAEQIKKITGRDDGWFPLHYSQRLAYTEDIEFEWADNIPDYFKLFETWWDMVKEGVSPAECYMFYIDNVPNQITYEWQEALNDAHKIWKPPSEQMPDEEAEKN
ncbi:MAG: hypothetical protein D6712_10595 [Chloroflexi bacterium]|nr:MAG: hypothetical protein D6712_10595 [Chloroflexota bacterium]